MDPIDQLLAIEEIKRLKARYWRCMDTKDWEGLRAVWAADAVQDMSMVGGKDAAGRAASIHHGVDEIMASMRGAVEHIQTVHHGHTPEIEMTSPTTANGVWAMEDKLRYAEGMAKREMHAYGHYHDTYEKIDGEWKIKTSRLVRLRRDEVAARPRRATVAGEPLASGDRPVGARLTKGSIDLGIVTVDIAASVLFYRDVLGFEDLGAWPNAGGLVHRLACGTSLIHLISPLQPPAAVTPSGSIDAATGYRCLSLSVENLAELVATCEAAGRTVAVLPSEVRPGVRRAVVEDPDGNLVELVEPTGR